MANGYDGSIRIKYDIDIKDANSKMLKAVNDIKKTEAEITRLKNRMAELAKEKIPTYEYKEMQNELAKAEKHADALYGKLRLMEKSGDTASKGYQNLKNQIRLANQQVDSLRAGIMSLETNKKAFVMGDTSEEYRKSVQKVQELNDKLKVSKKRLAEMCEKQKDIRTEFSQMVAGANKIKEFLGRETKRSRGMLDNFASRFKSITLSLLVFNWITKGFNAMVSDIGEGYGRLLDYSDEYAASVQSLKNANMQLSNSFAAALSPAVQAVIPQLVELVDWTTEAVNTLGQLIAYLSGSKTWTKATKVTTAYKDSLTDTAAAAKDAYKALAGFDELNVLNKNENTGIIDGGASNQIYFEEVPINNDVAVFGDRIKKSFEEAYAAAEPFRKAVVGLWEDGLSQLRDFSAQGLKDFWEDFLQPLGTWAFGTEDKGLTRLVDIINDDLSRIPWEEINGNLKDFWVAIEPYAEEFGEGLIDFFEDVSNVSTDIFISLFGDEGALTDLTEWLNNGDPEDARKWGEALGQLSLAIAGFVVGSKIVNAIVKAKELLDVLGGLKALGTIALVVSVAYSGFELGKQIGKFLFPEDAELYDNFKWSEFFEEMSDTDFEMHIEAMKEWSRDSGGLFAIIDDIELILSASSELFSRWWKDDVTPWFTKDKWKEEFKNIKSAAGEIWANFESWWANSALSEWWKDDVTPWFTKDKWEGILEEIPRAFEAAFEDAKEAAIKILENLLGWFDNFSLFDDITDWVGGSKTKGVSSFIGSTTLGINIPALASGAVIRGGNPYLAWLGDQPAGQTNVEAPLSTIEQAVQNVIDKNSNTGEINLTVNLDGSAVYRSVVQRDRSYCKATGHSAFMY